MSLEDEPAMKKLKTGCDIDIINSINYCIQQIGEKPLQAVLGEDFYTPVPLTKVFIGHVKSPKQLSRIISILNEKIPLKELQHLKRVKKTGVILGPVNFVNNMSIQEFLNQYVPELSDDFDFFREIDVPAVMPKLKQQYNPATWSCNFHPNKYLEKLCSDDFFSTEELKTHYKYMKMAFETAKYYLHNNSDFTTANIQEINATVVVDPLKDSVVAISFVNKNHPLQHSSLLAIDNVAKTQHGGAWGETSQSTIGDCSLNGIDKDLLQHLKKIFTDTLFGARQYVSKRHEQTDCKEASVINEDSVTEGPYLCTGYNVYALKEPCVMCSMGLVHARAKRIFFTFDNIDNGALKSKTKLQALSSLNHHFEAFTGFL